MAVRTVAVVVAADAWSGGQLVPLGIQVRSDGVRMWMGSRPGTPDSLPVLGAAPGQPNLFLCLGHGHFGMTVGPPSGKLVAACVMGAQPPLDLARYALDRFSSRRTRAARPEMAAA